MHLPAAERLFECPLLCALLLQRGVALDRDPEYLYLHGGVSDALKKYLRRTGVPVPQSESNVNTPPKPPTTIPTDSDYVTSTLTIAGTEYELEYPVSHWRTRCCGGACGVFQTLA